MDKKRSNELLQIENKALNAKLERKRNKVLEYKSQAIKSTETESTLKKEVKYLIGKLMKAKSKLLEDGDFLSQTISSPGIEHLKLPEGSRSPFRTRSITKSITPKNPFKTSTFAPTPDLDK